MVKITELLSEKNRLQKIRFDWPWFFSESLLNEPLDDSLFIYHRVSTWL